MSRMQMLQKTANNSRNGEYTEKEENCNNINLELDYNIEMSEKQEEKHGGEEYCISAGAFARMCQTTRDTLRYYEKQGILVPKKSEKTGITITAMRRSAPFILSVPFVDWDVRWRI